MSLCCLKKFKSHEPPKQNIINIHDVILFYIQYLLFLFKIAFLPVIFYKRFWALYLFYIKMFIAIGFLELGNF